MVDFGVDRRNVLAGLIVVVVVIPFCFFVYQSQAELNSKVDMLERSVVVLSASNQELRSENEGLKLSVSRLSGFQELVSGLSDTGQGIARELEVLNDSVNKPVETMVSRLEFSGDAGLVQCEKAKCLGNLTAFSGKCFTESPTLELRGFGLAFGQEMNHYTYWECCYAVKDGASGTHSFDVEVYCR